MSEPLARRFFRWMSEPSKPKILAWRFFFWITPRRLSKKVQMYMLSLAERYPDVMERRISALLRAQIPAAAEALARLKLEGAPSLEQLLSEEALAAMSKQFLNLMHPEARKQVLEEARKRRGLI